MSFVPIHEEILNEQDVMYLVGSLISRQLEGFTSNQIMNLAKEYLKGIPYQISDEDLFSMIDYELGILWRTGFVEAKDGQYHLTIGDIV